MAHVAGSDEILDHAVLDGGREKQLYNRAPMKSVRLLYLIFFLSGATGLVYEVIWVRLTGLVFGNTSHAISVVLGAFMAGLALGSWWLGRRADRAKSALRFYGLLEIGIGVSASLVPFAFRSLDGVYWTLAPSLESVPGGNGVVRFLTSFLILIVPTFLMGGTLPVLARFFTESVHEVQRKVGLLYALNTFGAAFGTLAAALFFIPQLGNIRSTLLVASLNIAIGIFSFLMGGSLRVASNTGGAQAVSAEDGEGGDALTDRIVLATLATSGFVSMIYEVAWTRALTAIIGSSTYAFSVMLVTFLVGIAIGSSVAVKWRRSAGLRLLGLTQLGIAIGGFLFIMGYLAAPYVMVSLLKAFSYSFSAVLLSQFLLCFALMIFATVCMGAAMPIASQIYSNKITLLGRSIGNVYSVNTLGAIAGSVLAGFVLLPLLGTERAILVGLFINCGLAAVIFSSPRASRSRDSAMWVAMVLLVLATVSMRGGIFWAPNSLDRGVLVYAKSFDANPQVSINETYQDTDVVYFKDGNNATISVRKGEDYVGLRTNGKVDASNKADMITQLMIGYLPMLYHPAPKSTMVVGYGGGITVGAAAAFKEVEAIDVLEIEPAVIGAGPQFAAFNRQSYENPKVHILYNDARNYMNMTRKQYDVIISEPSNPWIAGVASLFTREFYDRAAQVLKPDGVFAQWVQLYELDPQDLRMILREFQEKFPHVSVWVFSGDLVVIGTRQPQHLNIPRWEHLAKEDPHLAHELEDFIKVPRPQGILAYYVMGSDAVRKFAGTPSRNTDDHPLLEFHAPRQLFRETRALNVALLYENKDGLVPEGADIGDPEMAYSSIVEPFLDMERSNLAAQAMGSLGSLKRADDASFHLAIGQIAYDRGELGNAESEFEMAAESAKPGNPLIADIQEMWGLVRQKLGDGDGAIEHFKASVAVQPERQLPLRRLAEIYGMRKEFKEGAEWMERYVATKPLALGHQYGTLGDYYLAMEDVTNALRVLQAGIDIDPYTFWVRYRFARLFEERKDTAKAIHHYEIAMRYGYDRDPEIYSRLANLYKAEGRLKEARKVLENGTRIFPTNSELYRLYGEIRGVN
jgi:spermidine synthase